MRVFLPPLVSNTNDAQGKQIERVNIFEKCAKIKQVI